MASEELVAKYLSIVKETIESIQKEENDFYLTAFEIETLAAFLMFKDEKVDIVVLEVGLGGRLDATNVIKNKELAIITSIGLDHCALLGNTLKEIAHEKAAIIKDVAITCMQDMDIIDAIGSHARKLIITAQPTLIQLDIESGQLIEYKSVQFKTKMLGAYQKENLSLALEAILYLISHGWDFNLDKIKEGVLNASWKVRFEVKKIKNKYVILDGSHNPQGASSLVDTLNVYFRNKNIHFIIGMLKDKDMKGILEILLPLSTRTTFISSVSSRAASTLEEENIARELGYDVYVSNDINKAIKEELTLDEDALVICGSLTLFETIEI